METLARRLDQVEWENRWLKRAGVIALAVIAAVVLIGMSESPPVPSKVVEAEKFVLVDTSGKVRAELGPTEAGILGWPPGLTFYDSKGNEVVQLYVDDEFATLGIAGKEGRVGMWVSRQPLWGDLGLASLFLGDKDEKNRAVLTLRPDGGVALSLLDRDEKARAKLALIAEGTPRLTLSDKAGKVI